MNDYMKDMFGSCDFGFSTFRGAKKLVGRYYRRLNNYQYHFEVHLR